MDGVQEKDRACSYPTSQKDPWRSNSNRMADEKVYLHRLVPDHNCIPTQSQASTFILGLVASNRPRMTNSDAAPHPTAKAFFDALDAKRPSSKQSVALQRRSQSLGWRNRYSQSEHYPTSVELFDRTVTFSVRQVQRGEVEGTYGTGATVWPAAVVLVKYLSLHPELVRDKRVVDLGSGTGVTSLAAAILGCSHVVCTDGEDSVVQLAMDNCRNAVSTLIESVKGESSVAQTSPIMVGKCPIVVQKYWWGTQPLPDDQCEVILVADCVLPKLYPVAPLVQAIDELLRASTDVSKERVAILSYEHRYYPDYDPRTKFRELAQERGLVVQTLPAGLLDPVYSVDDIEIWHVSTKKDNLS